MAKACGFRKKNGQPCDADAQSGKDVCVFHDPRKAVDGRRARQAGGRNRPRSLAVLPADTPDHPLDPRDVTKLLAQSINQLRRGRLDPKVANAIGYQASVLLRLFEQGRTQEPSPNLEDAVAKNPKLSSDFVDELVARKLATHQTQPSCGDKDFFYGAEVTYKRLGLIQPNSVKAVANGGAALAGAAAVNGATFRERFKSMLLLRKEMEMISDFEAEANTATNPPPSAGHGQDSHQAGEKEGQSICRPKDAKRDRHEES